MRLYIKNEKLWVGKIMMSKGNLNTELNLMRIYLILEVFTQSVA